MKQSERLGSRRLFSQALRHARVLLVISLYNLINALFLVIWALPQWALKVYFVDRQELIGLDKLAIQGFQVIFFLSTLAPVLVWFYVDAKQTISAFASITRSPEPFRVVDGHRREEY